MRIALVGAGSVSKSFLARLPGLGRQLGPILAPNYRVASRIANAIHAGYPSREYNDIDDCTLVLLCAPERKIPELISAISAPPMRWRHKTVLLCGGRDGSAAEELRRRGAAVGRIVPVEGFEAQMFIVEGERRAVRAARRLAQEAPANVIELKTGCMPLYWAAVSFGTSLFTPLIQASVECLREAGVPAHQAYRLAEALFQKSLRAYLHAHARSWRGPLARGDWNAVEQEIEALREKPALEHLYRQVAQAAVRVFERAVHARAGFTSPH